VYGAPDYPDTLRTRRHLDELGVAYRCVDVEGDESASERVKRVNGGKRKTPTMVLGGRLARSAWKSSRCLRTRFAMPRWSVTDSSRTATAATARPDRGAADRSGRQLCCSGG
jgi:glutaredoxin